MNVFTDIGLLIILATLLAYVAKLLKQPITPAYIVAGIILGPVFNLMTDAALITNLSEIGIAFLLFIVGLELDFKRMKSVGKIASLGGILQVSACFVGGFTLASLLGFDKWASIFLGLVVAFSSTMIVIKLLSDKKVLDTLHGRIVLGILLMQDVLAILALSLVSSAGLTSIQMIISIAEAVLIISAALLLSKYVFPTVFKFAARTQELLLLVSLSVCFIFALLFHMIHLSMAIGAFIAGVALANLPYSYEIVGKVKSLRDFFAILFFAALGMQLSFVGISSMLFPLILFSIFVLVGKFLIILLTASFFGYSEKTSFLSASSLSQISEFSLIIVALGVASGKIGNEILTLTILLAMITMTLTSYFIKYDDEFYYFLSKKLKLLKIFSFGTSNLEYIPEQIDYDAILCGYDRVGYSVLKSFVDGKKNCFVVDFNPDVIKSLINRKIPCMYGDISDEEILDRIDFEKAKIVVSTANLLKDNLLLLKLAKKSNSKLLVFVTANRISNALKLYSAGADYVILPHFLGGEKVSSIIGEMELNTHTRALLKAEHMVELKKRASLGHEHPELSQNKLK